MSARGATLQSFNNELVQCIEDLKDKLDGLNAEIKYEEEEKSKIQNDILILTERLSLVNESLSSKRAKREEYERTIKETELAFQKIIESSQTLLQVLKREMQDN
eukprot:GCRY01003876.1.p1 GENE.GCRY01003876.1~~GCRY01003876.1.p1  ORF type:complete len:104 (+),score=16.28 GCRY01003876.1:150-461(+)